MMNITQPPALFGISRSNRNFSDAYYWGKNQFNSAFPVALACYMRSQSHPLMYVKFKDSDHTQVTELAVTELFGSTLPNEQLHFSFETRFDPFRTFVHDELPTIDLVVGKGDPIQQLRPIEIKLTTLPDITTEAGPEDKYGAKLVDRDEFDPLFPNKRKGWHQRPMREYCKKIYDNFDGLDLENFTSLLKQILYKEHDLDLLIEDVAESGCDTDGSFAKRLLTGQAAEQYFMNAFKSIPTLNGLNIRDTTKLGCGFDFQLYSPSVSLAVEVKGLNNKRGNITLTEKEHAVASRMGDRYFLFFVKNFKEKPIHDLYQNPLGEGLVFTKVERHIIQTSWTTRM